MRILILLTILMMTCGTVTGPERIETIVEQTIEESDTLYTFRCNARKVYGYPVWDTLEITTDSIGILDLMEIIIYMEKCSCEVLYDI